MSKKHFEAAAAIVRGMYAENPAQREAAIEVLVELFSKFNDRFNAALFRAACQPEGGAK